jgi:hypothetical protein
MYGALQARLKLVPQERRQEYGVVGKRRHGSLQTLADNSFGTWVPYAVTMEDFNQKL